MKPYRKIKNRIKKDYSNFIRSSIGKYVKRTVKGTIKMHQRKQGNIFDLEPIDYDLGI